MNISRLNFIETLPLINKVIAESHFIALDLEMSGLVSSDNTKNSLVDTYQERYEKTRININRFLPLQVGLCGFKILPSENKIISYPFNFYVFPLLFNQENFDQHIFHLGSMNFLAKHNFDFNKLFYEGIPFISKSQKVRINQKKAASRIKIQLMKMNLIISPDMRAFFNLHFPSVQAFIRNSTPTEQLRIPIKFIKFRTYKYLIDQIQQRYPSVSLQYTFDQQSLYLRSYLIIKQKPISETPTQQQLTLENLINEDQSLFNILFQKITDLKKPILVHNGFIDLMHIHHRFYEDLPVNWQSYIRSLSQKFRLIYDTKYIASSSPILFNKVARITNLENLYRKTLQIQQQDLKNNPQIQQTKERWPKIVIDQDFKQYGRISDKTQENQQQQQSELKMHQAGYDALMTGASFFRLNTLSRISLKQLASQQFFTKPSLQRNRIPLGNIKVPLNFEEIYLQDIYTKDSTPKLFFSAIKINSQTEKLLKNVQVVISEHFTKLHGPVNIIWEKSSYQLQNLTFLKDQNYQKFCRQNLDQKSVGLYKINDIRYLVTPFQEKKQLDSPALSSKATHP